MNKKPASKLSLREDFARAAKNGCKCRLCAKFGSLIIGQSVSAKSAQGGE